MRHKNRLLLRVCLLIVCLPAAGLTIIAQAPAEKFATIYGQKIRYLEAGSGPATVVLLHGLGGNAENWPYTIPALAQKYRVIAPDQIGFGKSDKPMAAYRVGMYVDFLDALLKNLKIEKATLVGNSLGGWIAASYTLEHPERVEKLVLVDAGGYSIPKDINPNELYATLNPVTRKAVRETLKKVFYNSALIASDAFIDNAIAARLATGDGYTINAIIQSVLRGEDVLDGQLGGLKAPTLIVWGKQDGLLPLAFGERFKNDIKGSQLFVIDQCGHAPQLEKAAEFNAALLKFLSQ